MSRCRVPLEQQQIMERSRKSKHLVGQGTCFQKRTWKLTNHCFGIKLSRSVAEGSWQCSYHLQLKHTQSYVAAHSLGGGWRRSRFLVYNPHSRRRQSMVRFSAPVRQLSARP